MDLKIRSFLEEIIALINKYNDIPLEARRLALESATHLVEKASDQAIASQSMEGRDAESVFESKLGELSERGDTSQRE